MKNIVGLLLIISFVILGLIVGIVAYPKTLSPLARFGRQIKEGEGFGVVERLSREYASTQRGTVDFASYHDGFLSAYPRNQKWIVISEEYWFETYHLTVLFDNDNRVSKVILKPGWSP